MFNRLFLDHPRSIDESYREHFVMAGGFAFAMISAGFACLIHAFVPGLFVTTGSDAIERLNNTMVVKRRDRLRQGNTALLPPIGD